MRYVILVMGFVLVLSGNTWAMDIWDEDGGGDNTAATTNNILSHVAPAQVHDLENLPGPASDQDWYRIFPRAYRSYEVDVFNVTHSTRFDSPSGGVSDALTRRNVTGTTVVQNSVTSEPSGKTRKVRWWNIVDSEERILVTNGYTDNSASTQYSIKLYDTTLSCPRFNNAGTQVSVLIMQPSTGCSAFVVLYEEDGTRLEGPTYSPIQANQLIVLPLSVSFPGKKGSARILNTCEYGGMAAKLVALEPSTGFSFDTPCTYLPY